MKIKFEQSYNKININIFGIKIKLKKMRLLNPFKKPIFRNDDVSVDTNLDHFKDFCAIFHKYGYTQLHAINLYGWTNCNYIENGSPVPYKGYNDIATLDYDTIKKLSADKFIGDNKQLIDYINSIPDDIGLHGLYHSDYSKMTYEQQYADIKEGLRLLKILFPKKKVKTFIAPFNRTNKWTYEVCKKFGLRVSALEGEHLEDMIAHHQYGIKRGEIYRFHHHRFYPETTFDYYDLSIEKLDNFFSTKAKRPKICLLCDKPNWAFDISAKEIASRLSDSFDFDIKYVRQNPKLKAKKYDLIHVFFWGENYHKKFKFPKRKVLKEISSHRWEDNPQYGPCTPKEMADKYLTEANHVFCTSKRLYDLFKEVRPNVHWVENGYNAQKFFYDQKRTGKLSLCWAGNINDPVKGIKDIVIPAVGKRFKLDLASELAHDEMNKFYNQHDVFIVASRNEAEPLPLIESMAAGCFPVVCDVGLVPELIRHKKNGYIVEDRTPQAYQKAFEWCEKHLDLVRQAGKENAELMLKTKKWDIMVEGFRNLYKECLKG